ncbi:MAG: hypothetical protein HY791_34675 [Deltaproteobacteria bacterium]|nr:hypothetical protein [Deltaproteobacteria bacterium]
MMPILLTLLTQAPLDILYHADLEGRLAVPLCSKTGSAAPDFAALVGAIERARAEAAESGAPEPIALLGGDQIGPDLFVRSMLKLDGAEGAARVAAILDRANYAAVAIGNHDLELELDRLDRFAAALHERGVPIVSTNLSCDPKKNPFCAYVKPSLVVERAGSKVGILAVLSPKIASSLPAENRQRIEITDPLPAIRESVRALRAQGVSTIALMLQLKGGSSGYAEARELVLALGDVDSPDVVLSSALADLDGSSAVRLLRHDRAPALVGSSIGAGGVTRVRVRHDVDPRIDAAFIASATSREDPETRKLLDPEIARYCERYGTAIGPGQVRTEIRRSDFVSYTLSVMRRRAGAEVSIINIGFVKPEPFPIKATFTKAELLRAIPYHADLGAARLMGGPLSDLLKAALANSRVAVLGAEVVGGKVRINGRWVDAAREYTVATIPFLAEGGDDVFAKGALKLEPIGGEMTDIRELVQAFLEVETADEDGDPSIDVATDFGKSASQRLLVVGLADVGLDLATTSISNDETSSDPRLTRAEQRAIKAELGLVLQLRHPWHEDDSKLSLKYGYASTEAEGQPPVSAETDDLLLLSTLYSFRGFHALLGSDSIFLPEPYARGLLESELTVPDVTPTQTRSWRHAELSVTGGALFTLAAKLRLRAGAGARKELGVSADSSDATEVEAARARFMIEAGATLDPVALVQVGEVPIKLEAAADYFLLEPDRSAEQQLRATAKLSVPLVPMLFLTTGIDVFGVERRPDESKARAWAYSVDTTLGIRVHFDGAHQSL